MIRKSHLFTIPLTMIGIFSVPFLKGIWVEPIIVGAALAVAVTTLAVKTALETLFNE